VAEVEHRVGDLSPPVDFIVTTFHSQVPPSCGFTTIKGTAEQRSRKASANEVRLQLSGLAYDLGNPGRLATERCLLGVRC
jgi:hypothetical protein